MSRDDSADIRTVFHGTNDIAKDAALQRLLRGPDEPVSFDDPPPRGGAAVWIVFCAAMVVIVAWGVLA